MGGKTLESIKKEKRWGAGLLFKNKTRYFPLYKARGSAGVKNGITRSSLQILILLLSNYDSGQTVFSL